MLITYGVKGKSLNSKLRNFNPSTYLLNNTTLCLFSLYIYRSIHRAAITVLRGYKISNLASTTPRHRHGSTLQEHVT